MKKILIYVPGFLLLIMLGSEGRTVFAQAPDPSQRGRLQL